MKMTFLGAAHEVTGSCTYLEVGDKKGLVDYGMQQGRDLFENEPIPVPPAELDFVLLTHAHIDHAGLLPLLWKQGFRGSVYTSSATVQLCDIMLCDSANIQQQEAEWKNRRAQRSGGEAVEPLYDLEDVDGIMSRMIPCPYDEIVQVNDCVSIRLTDVGHLLGSAAIEVWLRENVEERKLCFSGDIGNLDQPILRDPMFVRDAQVLVIESTYGDRLHSHERVDYVQALASRIQETLDKGGNVIIPAFAVGRTQELLYFLREIKERGLVTGHGDFPVYVDSPLAIEATSIFLQCDTSFLDEDTQALIRSGVNPIWFDGLELSVSKSDSQAINEDPTPKVVLSASGMCDAGRIRHHLKHNLWREECRVLFVGYQAEGTLGRILVDGASTVKLFDETIEVNAAIDVLPGVSGHADKLGLISWLKGCQPRRPRRLRQLCQVSGAGAGLSRLRALQRHLLRPAARRVRDRGRAAARRAALRAVHEGRAHLRRVRRRGRAAFEAVPRLGGPPQQGSAALDEGARAAVERHRKMSAPALRKKEESRRFSLT